MCSSATIRMQHHRPNVVRRAFSLVEAVISIGVVSFAMMGILGMVPVGLATFRHAMNLTVESAIVQEVTGELLRTDHANLSADTLYFDEQGNPVPTADHPSRIYTVDVPSPRPLEASGLVASSAASTVTISIHHRAEPSAVHRFSVVIPRDRSHL